MTYQLPDYVQMVVDDVRRTAHLVALRAAVTPGCHVLEVGTGPGFFAVAAATFGAGRVTAIETADAVRFGPALAAANGVADRVTFVQRPSEEVTLDRPADVLVADLRGVLPLLGTGIATFADARDRLLRPGGAHIPCADTIRVALAVAPAKTRALAQAVGAGLDGLSLAPLGTALAATWRPTRLGPADLRSEAGTWVRIDYATARPGPLDSTVSLTARGDHADGLLAWFDADLGYGVTFSTGPESPETVYRSAFFPFDGALPLAAGERVAVRLRSTPISGEWVYAWEATARAGTRSLTSLSASAPGSAALRRQAIDYVPRLDPRGALEAFTLGLMDGSRSLQSIARIVHAEFPGLLRSPEAATAHVARMSLAHGGGERTP